MKSMYDDFYLEDDKGKKQEKNEVKKEVKKPATPMATPAVGATVIKKENDTPANDTIIATPVAPEEKVVDTDIDTADDVIVSDVAVATSSRFRIVGVVNLALLVAVIAMQFLIINWQRDVSSSVAQLQEEVKLEKQQRIELGRDLLGKIEGVIQQKGISTQSAAVSDGRTVYMTTSKINLRKGKSAKTKLVMKLKKGGIVTHKGASGVWVNIAVGSKSGWVMKKYISEISMVKIKASKLSVRSKPSKKGNILTKVKKNTRGKVVDYKNKYFQAQFGATLGWVHRDYVTALK